MCETRRRARKVEKGKGKYRRESLGRMFSRASQAWRQHPLLTQNENIKHMFPGLGTAAAIFSVYVFGEAFYNTMTASSKHSQKASANKSEVNGEKILSSSSSQ